MADKRAKAAVEDVTDIEERDYLREHMAGKTTEVWPRNRAEWIASHGKRSRRRMPPKGKKPRGTSMRTKGVSLTFIPFSADAGIRRAGGPTVAAGRHTFLLEGVGRGREAVI